MTFYCYVKETFFALMEALVYQKKSLVLILVKQIQSFAYVHITLTTIVTCLLTKNKFLSLKQ